MIIGCAKKGIITGGKKDTIAPKMISSFPKNFSTNFNGKEIKLNFDEFVKLKNVNKQLIISPPMKKQPDILPYNASKTVNIKIKDTLLPNTTYSFNFGTSIQDNNEGNPYEQFKFVFSTGNFIDSLKLGIKIKDAINRKTDNFVSVMLYEYNEKYNENNKNAPLIPDSTANKNIFLDILLRSLSYIDKMFLKTKSNFSNIGMQMVSK